jgi:hypothetical protein
MEAGEELLLASEHGKAETQGQNKPKRPIVKLSLSPHSTERRKAGLVYTNSRDLTHFL